MSRIPFDITTARSQSLVKSVQAITAETTEYSKKVLESGSTFVGSLMAMRSLESVLELQSEFAKASYADFVAHAQKFGELCFDSAKNACKPVDGTLPSPH